MVYGYMTFILLLIFIPVTRILYVRITFCIYYVVNFISLNSILSNNPRDKYFSIPLKKIDTQSGVKCYTKLVSDDGKV